MTTPQRNTTARIYEGYVRRFYQWRTAHATSSLADDAMTFIQELEQAGRAPSTVFVAMHALKHELDKQGADERTLRRFRYKMPDREEKQPEYLSSSEVRRLVDGCKSPLSKTVIALTFDTGARANEIIELKYPDDIDFQQLQVHVRRKGGRIQWCKITTAGAAAIKEWLKKRGTYPGRLFIDWTYEDIRRKVKADAELLGIKNFHLHMLRHSRAHHMHYEQGLDWKQVQEQLGHKDIGMTINVYGRLKPADVELPSW